MLQMARLICEYFVSVYDHLYGSKELFQVDHETGHEIFGSKLISKGLKETPLIDQALFIAAVTRIPKTLHKLFPERVNFKAEGNKEDEFVSDVMKFSFTQKKAALPMRWIVNATKNYHCQIDINLAQDFKDQVCHCTYLFKICIVLFDFN